MAKKISYITSSESLQSPDNAKELSWISFLALGTSRRSTSQHCWKSSPVHWFSDVITIFFTMSDSAHTKAVLVTST